MSTPKKPTFTGTIRAYCENAPCPVREVPFLVKFDARPEAPARCPRCRRPLKRFGRVSV